MAKKIMMDMKLNSRRVIKPSQSPKIEEKEVVKQPEIKKESRDQDESIQSSNVFVSGWQARPPKESAKNIIVNNYGHIRESSKMISSTPVVKKKSGGLRKSFITLLIIAIVIAGGYFIAMHFEKTTIVLKEKSQVFTLDHEQFTASKDAKAPLNFEIMISSDTDSKDIVMTDSENVSLKAKGTITLFNENSTKPQTIAINSFVADTSGKTYKTDKAVVIPGYTMNGAKVVPGQASVTITAFLPGDQYNGTPTDFTISGFKGTDKFKKIYGKASTPITGGAQGLVYVLGPTEKGSLNASAVSSFQSRLLSKVNAEVPKGYILYPNASAFSYTFDDTVTSPTPNAKVAINGTLSAIIFKEDDLSDAIIKNVLPNISSDEHNEIQMPDISKLAFAFTTANQPITKDMQSVSFTLSGLSVAMWHPDQEALKYQLVGVSKVNLPSIFKSDPGITEARATIFPPWRTYLPDQISKISISAQ